MKQNFWAAGAVAALMAVCTTGAMAQDDTNPGPTVQPTTFTPIDIPTISAPSTMNYKVLIDQPFTYMDIAQAERTGLSDRQIARIAKISQLTGVSFQDIREEVLAGETFPKISERYGVSIAQVYDDGPELQTIENYKAAYRTTGYDAIWRTRMNGSPYDMPVASAPAPVSTPVVGDNDSVLAIAMATPRLSTLVAAIKAAGLVDALNGEGPFTIFAPDNAAFGRLPKGELANLMADPMALASVLEYHVISGQKIDSITAMTMSSPTSPPTLEGGTLQVTTSNGKVMINNAQVVQANIEASNGIIHIINQVLMPPKGM